jgi:uncharacterized protein YggU (UPF0235/DUF167 family)
MIIFNNIFSVLVKPNSVKSKYLDQDNEGKHIISLKEKTINNKANLALLNFFKQEFNLKVKIKSGLKNRIKILEIIN